jgi:hypothetical protein
MLGDFVLETTSAPGTSTTITLAGAATGPFCRFRDKFSSGNPVYFTITDNATQSQAFRGTLTTGTPDTLTVVETFKSNAGTTTRLNFTGTCYVSSWIPSDKALFIDGTDTVDMKGSDTKGIASANGGPLAGFRNVIINGAMDIWQRGTTITTLSSYMADRWTAFMNGSGATLSATRQSVSTQALLDLGFRYYLSYALSGTITGATANQFIQNIEDVRTLSGRPVAVSFWASCASGTLACSAVLSQNFGTGGSPSSSVDTSLGSFSVTTTWQKFTFNTTLPSIVAGTRGSNANDALRLVLNLPTNAAMTLNITGVQVEPGSTATPFEFRPLTTEQLLCWRYFWVLPSQLALGGFTDTGFGVTVGQTVLFPVKMRAIPTVSTSFAAGSGNAAEGVASISTGGFEVFLTATGVQGGFGIVYNSGNTASAEL